jgi:hypothetical protein
MDVKGYAKVRAALDAEGIICGISPVPAGDENFDAITLRFTSTTSQPLAIYALSIAGLLCDDGARLLQNDNPALRVVRITPTTLELEDMNVPVIRECEG